MTSRGRLANLLAALGFLQLPPRAPEPQLLHRWLDSWTGIGLITVGVERQGLRLSLSHINWGLRAAGPVYLFGNVRVITLALNPQGSAAAIASRGSEARRFDLGRRLGF